MKLSFNTETLFQGNSIYESMRILHERGLDVVEFWSWQDKDLSRVKALKEEYGMDIASIVMSEGSMVDPARREETLQLLQKCAEAARYLECRTLVHTVGFEQEGLTRAEMRQSLIEGLKAAIPILEQYGVTTAIEPLNTTVDLELQGYYLNTSSEAFEIVKEIDHPLVKVCYDMYHVQIMEGNVLPRLQNNIRYVGHIQAAGSPGRHELYIGELNYGYILDAIKQMDYSGYVGIEYFPVHDPLADLCALHAKHHTE